MRRRQALLSVTALLAGFAGCSGPSKPGTRSPTELQVGSRSTTESSSGTRSPTESPAGTPPADFDPAWLLDRDDGWTEQRRETEYPDSDESADWTPNYARSVEYVYNPSREELADAVDADASDVPATGCANLSKWAFPTEFPGTPADLVAEVRDWFGTQFDECAARIENRKSVKPWVTELESGRTIGWEGYDVAGETGRLESPFRASAGGDSVEVHRVTYEAEGVLYALLGPEDRAGFLAGGSWLTSDEVKLHTDGHGEIWVSAEVNGKSWGIEDELIGVLNDIEQRWDGGARSSSIDAPR